MLSYIMLTDWDSIASMLASASAVTTIGTFVVGGLAMIIIDKARRNIRAAQSEEMSRMTRIKDELSDEIKELMVSKMRVLEERIRGFEKKRDADKERIFTLELELTKNKIQIPMTESKP